MKFFTNKSIILKIAVVLIILLLINLIVPNMSHADKGDGGIGGALFKPILELLVGIADWFMSFLQKAIYGVNESLLHIDRNEDLWSTVWGIAAALVVVAGCIAVTVLTAGGGAAAIAAAVIGSSITVAVAGGITFVTVKAVSKAMLPDDTYLPIMGLSPETIFKRRNTDF